METGEASTEESSSDGEEVEEKTVFITSFGGEDEPVKKKTKSKSKAEINLLRKDDKNEDLRKLS